MSPALALATVLGLTAQGPDVAQLMRDACVSTGMRRDAFERLVRERRWRRARTTSDVGSPGGWNVLINGDGATLILSYLPDFGADATLGSSCTVLVQQAEPGLPREVGDLAASLGLTEEAANGLPEGYGPMRTWSRLGDSTLTYATAPDGRASVSLSRQIVRESPGPTPPAGGR
jgi:hypothetical protein